MYFIVGHKFHYKLVRCGSIFNLIYEPKTEAKTSFFIDLWRNQIVAMFMYPTWGS